MKVETIFASNSQVVMNIRIMLFIVMMMVMPVSYAACYSELSVQHNLVVQGDFALTQTQMATYEHNFNDSSCVSTNTITPMSPSDIIVGLYNDTIKLNLHFEWTNKNNITLSNNQTSFTSGYSVTVTPAASTISTVFIRWQVMGCMCK